VRSGDGPALPDEQHAGDPSHWGAGDNLAPWTPNGMFGAA
jgi:hypothetical protein